MRYTLKRVRSKGPRPYVIFQNGKAHNNFSRKSEAVRALKRYRKQIKQLSK